MHTPKTNNSVSSGSSLRGCRTTSTFDSVLTQDQRPVQGSMKEDRERKLVAPMRKSIEEPRTGRSLTQYRHGSMA